MPALLGSAAATTWQHVIMLRLSSLSWQGGILKPQLSLPALLYTVHKLDRVHDLRRVFTPYAESEHVRPNLSCQRRSTVQSPCNCVNPGLPRPRTCAPNRERFIEDSLFSTLCQILGILRAELALEKTRQQGHVSYIWAVFDGILETWASPTWLETPRLPPQQQPWTRVFSLCRGRQYLVAFPRTLPGCSTGAALCLWPWIPCRWLYPSVSRSLPLSTSTPDLRTRPSRPF